MKNFLKLTLSVLLLGFVVACSSSDDPKQPDPVDPVDPPKAVAKFVKNVLVEDYTATWCGYCPRVAYAIKKAQTGSEKVIAIAIHGNNDPYYYSGIGSLASTFDVKGYPTAVIDREYHWPYPEENAGLDKGLDKKGYVGLALKTTIENNQLTIVTKSEFAKDYAGTKLVVALIEDKLVHDQANYYNDGKGNPIKNFEHNHVLRKFLTPDLGEVIPTDKAKNGKTYEKTFTVNISDFNSANCHVVAFVVESSKKVLNVQHVKAGENVDFQKL
ncbi:hypothetical protein EMN47_16630 [Prolixibacteraceae bacterium JC049]|nr:hypothetical protein [Prolixibacteraceae bacterium JC049]